MGFLPVRRGPSEISATALAWLILGATWDGFSEEEYARGNTVHRSRSTVQGLFEIYIIIYRATKITINKKEPNCHPLCKAL